MRQCLNCHHNELTGALFCSECDARLVFQDTISSPPPFGVPVEVRTPDSRRDADIPPRVALQVLNDGQVLPFEGDGEATVGRFNEGQPLIPGIDLAPFGALQAGVSRFHASIVKRKEGIALVDLGPIKDTFINGKKVVPNTSWSLLHGDIVDMGDLRQ
ncbi:MAG: FHA domain-containing protein [Anaerolineales bacterium]|nr:FHA domain-containing protein [Anaerolineales bacterium]